MSKTSICTVRVEINEAQGAQTLAVQRELDLDPAKLNLNPTLLRRQPMKTFVPT